MSTIREGFGREHHFAGHHEDAKRAYRQRMHDMTPEQRLAIAWELTRRAYGENLDEVKRMDRTVFSMRKHQR